MTKKKLDELFQIYPCAPISRSIFERGFYYDDKKLRFRMGIRAASTSSRAAYLWYFTLILYAFFLCVSVSARSLWFAIPSLILFIAFFSKITDLCLFPAEFFDFRNERVVFGRLKKKEIRYQDIASIIILIDDEPEQPTHAYMPGKRIILKTKKNMVVIVFLRWFDDFAFDDCVKIVQHILPNNLAVESLHQTFPPKIQRCSINK